jgi:hypothetical protein
MGMKMVSILKYIKYFIKNKLIKIQENACHLLFIVDKYKAKTKLHKQMKFVEENTTLELQVFFKKL